MMELSEAGEFGVLGRIRKLCPAPGERIVIGIGDDAALIQSRPGYSTMLTTDALAEKIHFDLRYVPLEALGWKSLAVNLSDVAAMGGRPVCCLVTLGIPDRWSVEDVLKLYQGIARCADRYRCPVVGGDTVRASGESFISITVMGEVRPGGELRRSGALPGDILCVTGELGAARAGWEVLQEGTEATGDYRSSISRFLEPKPRLDEGALLAGELEPTSMIDISDGLASEIRHLCRESGCGCMVFEEDIPIAEESRLWSQRKGYSPVRFAVESGEEYELLFTVNPDRLEWYSKNRHPKDTVPFSIIGEMKPLNEGIRMRSGSEIHLMTFTGWDHYRRTGGGA
jgi:thiamine-monophosphate kinase